MTTTVRFLEPLAGVISRRTGVEFIVENLTDSLYGENGGVIVRRSGGMAIVFEPQHQNFVVGIITGDVWIATGYDLETMLDSDPKLIDILAGRSDPFADWGKPEATKPPAPKRDRFSVSFFGMFEIAVRW